MHYAWQSVTHELLTAPLKLSKGIKNLSFLYFGDINNYDAKRRLILEKLREIGTERPNESNSEQRNGHKQTTIIETKNDQRPICSSFWQNVNCE